MATLSPKTHSKPKRKAAPPSEDQPASEMNSVPGQDEAASENSAESAAKSQPEPLPIPAPPEVELTQPGGSWALQLLVMMAVLYTLYFARAVLLPAAMAIVLSLLLRPLVRGLARRRVPEFIGAPLCLFGLAALLVIGVLQLAGPAQKWVADFPELTRIAAHKLRSVNFQISQWNKAKEKFEEIAAGEVKPAVGEPGLAPEAVSAQQESDLESRRPAAVVMQQPTLSTNFLLMSATGEFLAAAGLVVVLTFFLLTTGDRLINNVLTTLPSFRDKRDVVELIQNTQKGVSSYLSTVTLINICLGIATGLEAWVIGLPNPALWGVLAALLNYIPFLGAFACGALLGFVSVLTFDSLLYAAVAPICFYVTAALEGNILTPALLGKRMSLSPIMVIVYLTFWAWMWGLGGALLAVPLLAATKIYCDQFESTQRLGTMLGD